MNLLDLLETIPNLSEKVESLRSGRTLSPSPSLQNFTPGLAIHPKDTAALRVTKAESEEKPGQSISRDNSITSVVHFQLKTGDLYLGNKSFRGSTEQMEKEKAGILIKLE